jgi:hypothetical protein
MIWEYKLLHPHPMYKIVILNAVFFPCMYVVMAQFCLWLLP